MTKAIPVHKVLKKSRGLFQDFINKKKSPEESPVVVASPISRCLLTDPIKGPAVILSPYPNCLQNSLTDHLSCFVFIYIDFSA